VRRAFSEFLAIPTLIILGFLLLSAAMYWVDRIRIEQGWPQVLPVDHDSVRTFLSTIATSIITVTSITFSLLLVAVQQGATSLTAQVYDQFLRRRANQAYFGYFTGLALYCLLILAMVHPDYTPVYGAVLAFLLTVVALYLLILLIYSTIDQMRPVMIVQSIRDHTLGAREHQQSLLDRTRRESAASDAGHGVPIAATDSGYIAEIDLSVLECEALRCGAREIRLLRSVGDYVSLGQDIAELKPEPGGYDPDIKAIRNAITFTEQRDLDLDPAFGIEQLSTIAWTSASTSKSNPHPATLACWNLRDLIASWYPQADAGEPDGKCTVVYHDNVPIVLLRALESLSVVTSESMQHQTLAEVYRAFALGVRRMPTPLRSVIHGMILRSLSSLGDHVLTAELNESIDELSEAMEEVGMSSEALATARGTLALSIGRLAARSNRSTPDKLPDF
jgi:hypothetical protein